MKFMTSVISIASLLVALTAPAAAKPTSAECEEAYQVMFQGMISGSRKMSDEEMGWGLKWEKQKKAEQICAPIPSGLTEPVPAKANRTLNFDQFGAKHFVIENGDIIDIQPYDPSRSDCYTAFAAMSFGRDMYGQNNFSPEDYAWQKRAKVELDADGYCPAMPEEIAQITTSYVERFGYKFAVISGGKPYDHVCDEHKRAIYSNQGTGEARRWAQTYQMAQRWKQPSFARTVCDMMNGDITQQSGPFVEQARKLSADAQRAREAQRAQEIANLPPAAPTLSEQLQSMTKAMQEQSANQPTYRCYNNADGKTQTCGYVNR